MTPIAGYVHGPSDRRFLLDLMSGSTGRVAGTQPGRLRTQPGVVAMALRLTCTYRASTTVAQGLTRRAGPGVLAVLT